MYPFAARLIGSVLFVSSVSSASAQLLSWTPTTNLAQDTTTAQSPLLPTALSSFDNALPRRDIRDCADIAGTTTTTTTTTALTTIIDTQTKTSSVDLNLDTARPTVTVTSESTTTVITTITGSQTGLDPVTDYSTTITPDGAESTPASQEEIELALRKKTVPCSDCVKNSAEAARSKARATENAFSEIRDFSTVTGVGIRAVCRPSIKVETVILPGTVTSRLWITTFVTPTATVAPFTLTTATVITEISTTFEPLQSSATPESAISPTRTPPSTTASPENVAPTKSAEESPTTSPQEPAQSISSEESPSTTSVGESPPTMPPQEPAQPTSSEESESQSSITTALLPPSSEPTSQQTTPGKPVQTTPLTSSVQSQDTLQVETLAPTTALPAAPTNSPTELGGTDNAQPSGLLFTAPSLPSSEPVSRQTKSDLQMQAISWLTSDQSRQQAAYTSDIFPTPNQEQNSATSVMPTAPPVTTLGTNTFVPVAPSSVYVIDSQTLAAGGPAVTIFSSVLSLAADGDELLIAPTGFISNGQVAGPASTIQLSSNPSPNPLSAPAPIITTIGNSPITIPPFASSLVLTPSSGGSPVTLLPSSSALTLPGGTIISLSPANPASPSASPPVLIISSSGASFAQSITFPTPVPSSFPASTLTQKYPTQQPTTILGPSNLPIVMSGDSSLEVGGVTFSPGGPAATISGIAVSLGTSNSMLVVGSSTIAIAPTATGIGGDIYSELVDEEQTPNATNSGMTTSTLSTSKNSTANESGSESGPQATDSSVLLSNDALKSMMPWTKVMSGLLGIFLALFTL